MKKKEKEDLMEAVFGKNAKRRTLGSLKSNDFVYGDYSMKKDETDALNEILKQQSRQLSEMMKESSFSEADYQKLKQEIEQDFGVTLNEVEMNSTPVKSSKQIMDFQDVQSIVEESEELFPGQKAFIEDLSEAFSKPFLLENDKNDPKFIVCLCGQKGTGKSEMLNHVMEQYQKKGYFSSKEAGIVDLSLYERTEQEHLFVQDVYSALQKGEIVLFNNFHQTSFYLMPTLESLVHTGKLKLKKRYTLKQGQMQETGNTLTANVIDSLSFADKGIVFIADASLNDLIQMTGTGFFKGFHDVIETSKFTEEALLKISKCKLDEFVAEAAKLNIQVSFDEQLTSYLSRQFDEKEGLKALDQVLEKWLKALLQMKLDQRFEEIKKMRMSIKEDEVIVLMEDQQIDFLAQGHEKELDQQKKILDELNEIVGLDEVKQYVLSLKDHFRIQKLRAQKGMKTNAVSMHMIFTGNPGTGKTTIARIISRYLKSIGILSSGQLVEVTRADLVGRYVGHTAPQTENVIQSALGGVLFIDEAYSLYRGKDDSFGLEAIDALVKGIEDYRDDLLVILAGYTKEMKEFLTSNSGLKSRFPNVIEFLDYTAEELLMITKSIAKGKQYFLNEDCDQKLLAYFEEVQSTRAADAGNGRLARNLVEAAILKQSSRCLSDETAALDELRAEDFEGLEV